MNYEESVRSLLALGRELAAPRQPALSSAPGALVQKLGLENIQTLSAELGNPHLSVPCVHIAGTNGKGSTAAMVESILRAAGLRTGLYTSPHLERINERIRIDGDEISDEAFAAAWTRVQAAIESLMASGKLASHPTFFECVTAIAFLAFADHRIGFAVYEVGLGGRLDSTNIVQPEVAILTPIDFDHENFLGHSIEEIAGEKAGIIKPGASIVAAPQSPEAISVIRRRATELSARLVEVDAVWKVKDVITAGNGRYRAVASSSLSNRTIDIAPALAGKFQIHNALTAATAGYLLAERGFSVESNAVQRGIAEVRWPGRLEKAIRRTLHLPGRSAQSRCRARAAKVLGRKLCGPPHFPGLRRDAGQGCGRNCGSALSRHAGRNTHPTASIASYFGAAPRGNDRRPRPNHHDRSGPR